jgi:hypothetical protein
VKAKEGMKRFPFIVELIEILPLKWHTLIWGANWLKEEIDRINVEDRNR